MNKLSLLSAFLLIGCSDAYLDAPVGDDEASMRWLQDGMAEAYGVLALLNDSVITEGLLDGAAALDVRAARGLIHHRNGPDGVFGTGDDDLFDSIDEVDGVYYVGNSALDRLVDFAETNGYVPAGDDWIGQFDDVDFTLDEAVAVVDLVNSATLSTLDDDLGLHAYAAANLVEEGPYDTVGQIAEVPWVGRTALETLLDAAF